MLAKTYSYGISGLDAYGICVEVDVSKGLPCTNIVGLPDSAIRESKERIRSAIKNSNYKYTPASCPHRKTINLSPADTKKEGPSYDLAMAIGILAATEQISSVYLDKYVILGELSLDGCVQPINGALAIAMTISKKDFDGLIVPAENAVEAAMSQNIPVFPVHTLLETIHLLDHPGLNQPFKIDLEKIKSSPNHKVDFQDVKGQSSAKRGLEIAAAGGHNVLLIGPPGSGKSMLAKRISTILPDMTLEESLETTKIHSAMGCLKNNKGIITHRPFRSPHHTTSDVALVGGGSLPKPGEVTLSHNGILFLDEFPEFNRNCLEALRQPLEDHYVTISRATKSAQFPANFMLIAAMNPCPCGWFTDSKKECSCSNNQIHRYMSRISGPLLDRIDIHLEVPALPSAEILSAKTSSENSQRIKERTTKARQRQLNRFHGRSIFANAQMDHRAIKEFCSLSHECTGLLKTAMEELNLSARAHDRILKVARTIADLDENESIESHHIAEAIQYRSLDRGWWGALSH